MSTEKLKKSFIVVRSRKGTSSSGIGTPENVRHHLHVDRNFNWTGEDPATAFQLQKKVGVG